jgi:hypothetical protein
MKLRTDLLKHLKAEDILEEAVATVHRFKPEPLLSKTETGSLLSASTEERAREAARSTELIQRVTQRAQQSGKRSAASKSASSKH